MITIQNLTKHYGTRPIFDRMSCSFNTGERVGLVGRNGEGKTTLLRMITGEETPDDGIISMPKNYRLGYLTQHIHFTKPTVLEEACLGLPQDREHEEWAVKIILSGLGYKEGDFNRSPLEFSGGYQIRLNLAKVLISEPDMLILDEPTNFLDIVSIRWLIEFLKNWKGEMILVSHDRNVMDSIATHILGIHRNRIKKICGTTGDYYDQIEREEEVHESRRISDEKSRKQIEQFITKFRAKAQLATRVQSRIKTLEKRENIQKLGKIATLSFSFNSAPFEAKYPLMTEDLTFSYTEGGINIIDHLNLTLEKEDRLCVIGKNGKGKTTLLKLLAGSLTPKSGKIRIHPQVKMGYYEQANTALLHPSWTVEEEITAGGNSRERKSIRDICGAMMFSGDDALKKISVLSGGEKCRVLLGKLLTQPANMLILDEPTHHLDMSATEALMESIEEFNGAVIMVTHNEHILESVATKLIVFQNDRLLIFPGTYNEFLDQVGWEEEAKEPGKNRQKFPEEKNAPLSKDQQKKMRTEFISRRSSVLNPLKKQVDTLEKQIIDTEKEIASLNDLLIKASHEQNPSVIAEHARALQQKQKSMDLAYEELTQASELYESQNKIFQQEEASLASKCLL